MKIKYKVNFIEHNWVKSRLNSSNKAVSNAVKKAIPDYQELCDEGFESGNAKILYDSVIIFYEARFYEDHIKYFDYPWIRIDSLEGKQMLNEAAALYLQNPWLHTKEFTLFILKILLDIEIFPMKGELTNIYRLNLMVSRAGLKPPSIFRPIRALSLPFTISLALTCIFAFSSGITVVCALSGIWAAFRFYSLYLTTSFLKKHARKYTKYTNIRDDIESNIFSPNRMKGRLVELEQSGAYVYSIAYDLLSLLEREALAQYKPQPIGLIE